MRNKCIGRQTVAFTSPPRIIAGETIVSKTEGEGPLGTFFDTVLEDDTWGEKTWELAERKMFEHVVKKALEKVKLSTGEVDLLLGGDLLNQIITANYAARELGIPFIGLYGACSTMAETLLVGSMLMDGGYASHIACAAASHFCTAERQYRMPLEMGTQAVPTAQRTVTGAACTLLADVMCADQAQFASIFITHGVIGRVIDLGISDAANMGAAMAPAAADTLVAHLKDTSFPLENYDIVVTGDLGKLGSELFVELCKKEGVDVAERHVDCGNIIFAPDQNVNCGGSGCACSAVTLNGYLLKRLQAGDFKRMFFMATGALMSTTSGMQGESIPGVAHGVVIERR
ncbi:MAG TPA: stage V sporulation protein AD [Clostridia bacterium]|nr:stage V sporulation protein AD [Clostridia bacterium]